MLKGTVESLSSWMFKIEKRLEEAEEKGTWIEAREKWRLRAECNRNFWCTLTYEVAKQRYGYWVQLAKATGEF